MELFALHVLGIRLHPGQVRFAKAVLRRAADGIAPRYLTLLLSSGNRAGKTLILAILCLHQSLYKFGLPSPDPTDERALKLHAQRAYVWVHFGISQDVAELVANEISAIMAGTHMAQKDGCPLTEEMGTACYTFTGGTKGPDRRFRWHESLGGATIDFKTTGEKAISQLGRDMNGISFDECGFEPNLDFIVDEVLHMRRLSTGGQLLLVSTPTEGINAFSDQWNRGDPDNPQRLDDTMSLRMSTRDNVGYGIRQEMFERMLAQMPPHLIPQNIDGMFIEGSKAFFDARAVDAMFVTDIPHREEPLPLKLYVQGVDPALRHDATWSIVMRVDPQSGLATGVLAQRLMGKQTVVNVVNLVRDAHIAFNAQGARCTTGLDSTGMGGKVFHDMLSDLPGIRQIDFGGRGQKKLTLLTDLKGLIESGKLRFPRAGLWLDLRRQLLGYRLADRGLATDGVMALAVAARVLHRYLQRLMATDPVSFDYWSAKGPVDPRGDALRAAISEGKGHLTGLTRGLTDDEFLRGRTPTSTLEGYEGPL